MTEWFCISSFCVVLLCCHGSGVLVAMLLVGGGGGACCCHGGRGPEGGGGGWLLGGGGGGGIMPIGGGSRPTRKPRVMPFLLQPSSVYCPCTGTSLSHCRSKFGYHLYIYKTKLTRLEVRVQWTRLLLFRISRVFQELRDNVSITLHLVLKGRLGDSD